MNKTLLTEPNGNPKTAKSGDFGYMTGILHLAPAKLSGKEVCASRTLACTESCLNTAGHGAYNTTQDARVKKTLFYFNNQKEFFDVLRADILRFIRKADKSGLIPVFRLNGTSDLPSLARKMAKEFPNVQFYDYTKHPQPWTRELPNYDLTFSYTGENKREALDFLNRGGKVAVVFGKALPETFLGFRVVNGDLHDLTFLTKGPAIIGLKAKGKAKKDTSGFVVRDY